MAEDAQDPDRKDAAVADRATHEGHPAADGDAFNIWGKARQLRRDFSSKVGTDHLIGIKPHHPTGAGGQEIERKVKLASMSGPRVGLHHSPQALGDLHCAVG